MLVLAKAPGHDLHCDLSFFFLAFLPHYWSLFFEGGEKIYSVCFGTSDVCVFNGHAHLIIYLITFSDTFPRKEHTLLV